MGDLLNIVNIISNKIYSIHRDMAEGRHQLKFREVVFVPKVGLLNRSKYWVSRQEDEIHPGSTTEFKDRVRNSDILNALETDELAAQLIVRKLSG